MSKKDFSEMTPAARQKLAAQVKQVRIELGLTQAQLASRAGTSRQTINNLETGNRLPRAGTLEPILGVLGITLKRSDFEADTQAWLNAIGAILDSLPTEARNHAGQAAFDVATSELVAHSLSNVTPMRNTVTTQLPDDLEETWALAAHDDTDEPEENTI